MGKQLEGMPDVITPQELADYLRVNVVTIVRALKTGRLLGFKVGRDWRVYKEDAIDYLGKKD